MNYDVFSHQLGQNLDKAEKVFYTSPLCFLAAKGARLITLYALREACFAPTRCPLTYRRRRAATRSSRIFRRFGPSHNRSGGAFHSSDQKGPADSRHHRRRWRASPKACARSGRRKTYEKDRGRRDKCPL